MIIDDDINEIKQQAFEKDLATPLSDQQAIEYFKANIDVKNHYSFGVVQILPEFKGMLLNKVIMQYIISFKPKRIEICRSGQTMEGKTGCISIWLDEDNRIKQIELGMVIELPENDDEEIENNAYIMDCVIESLREEND